jgi:hypothetical protein
LKEQGNDAFAAALAKRAADPAFAERVVDIVVDFDGDFSRWTITDQGDGFDVERILARCLSDDPEVLLSSGRGILMMKSFLDDVQFELGGRRAILTLARDSGAEKRRATRVPLHMPFQVTPLAADGTPQWAESISILQQHLSNSGQVLIGVPTERGIVQIPAEVKHSRAFGASGIELGCQFLGESNAAAASAQPKVDVAQAAEIEQAVSRILDAYRLTEVTYDERRTHPRVVYNERVTIHRAGDASPLIAFARDLSKGGVSLICQQPLAGNTTIALLADPPLRLLCRVVRCSLIQEGFYDVGAAFVGIHADA